jgi:hypothetical protein
LALARKFKEAGEVKEKADALQLKLAMQTLLQRQKDEEIELEERKQQGFAFIETERAKTRKRLMRLMGRGEKRVHGKRNRNGPRKTSVMGLREKGFSNFDGLALRRYCAEKRAKTSLGPIRGKWT